MSLRARLARRLFRAACRLTPEPVVVLRHADVEAFCRTAFAAGVSFGQQAPTGAHVAGVAEA